MIFCLARLGVEGCGFPGEEEAGRAARTGPGRVIWGREVGVSASGVVTPGGGSGSVSAATATASWFLVSLRSPPQCCLCPGRQPTPLGVLLRGVLFGNCVRSPGPPYAGIRDQRLSVCLSANPSGGETLTEDTAPPHGLPPAPAGLTWSPCGPWPASPSLVFSSSLSSFHAHSRVIFLGRPHPGPPLHEAGARIPTSPLASPSLSPA